MSIDKVDILYVAWNRLEFTRFSFEKLLECTDWSLVDRLLIHDDGSEDGTTDYLVEAERLAPVQTLRTITTVRSPPGVMNRYIAREDAREWFAKIDNDIVVCPEWLETMLDVLNANPHVDLLGMEAGRMGPPESWERRTGRRWEGFYYFEPGTHIGGVGLMRTTMFRERPQMVENGRFGFTEFQHEYDPVRGWIDPDLPVAQLDRIGREPWKSLSEYYIERGWSRYWSPYHPTWRGWWEE